MLREDQDHWNALVHEIGHALVAQRLGHKSSWCVYPARTIGPRGWEGATTLPTNVPRDHRAIIGLAGAVSETLDGVIPISFEPSDLAVIGMLKEYEFSDTDAEYIGDSYTYANALRCIGMVRDLKAQIVDLALANGGAMPRNRFCCGEEL